MFGIICKLFVVVIFVLLLYVFSIYTNRELRPAYLSDQLHIAIVLHSCIAFDRLALSRFILWVKLRFRVIVSLSHHVSLKTYVTIFAWNQGLAVADGEGL